MLVKNSGRRLQSLAVAACVALAAAHTATAQTAISIGNTQALAFGKFAAGGGGSVTITTDGARSAAGGVLLLSASGGTAARFSVSGDPNLTYAIGLPADGTATLSNDTGQSMSLSGFSSTPGLTGQLDAGGNQTVSVGATLNVNSSQPASAYSGSFAVSVDYN